MVSGKSVVSDVALGMACVGVLAVCGLGCEGQVMGGGTADARADLADAGSSPVDSGVDGPTRPVEGRDAGPGDDTSPVNDGGTSYSDSGIHPVEPAGGFWMRLSDFETGTPEALADDTDGDLSGSDYAFAQTLFSNDNPHSGRQSARATLLEGTGGWGDWGMFWRIPNVHEGEEFWYRVWIHMTTDWQFGSSNAIKGLRVYHESSSGGGSFDIYPKSSHVLTENWIDLSGFYTNNTRESMQSPSPVNGWEAFEMYIKCSSIPGEGVYRAWRNGVLWFEDTETITIRDSGGRLVRTQLLTHYDNDTPSPLDQSIWIDDVVLTNRPPNNFDAHGNAFIGLTNSDRDGNPYTSFGDVFGL